MLLSNRNQSTDLLCKISDWFLFWQLPSVAKDFNQIKIKIYSFTRLFQASLIVHFNLKNYPSKTMSTEIVMVPYIVGFEQMFTHWDTT